MKGNCVFCKIVAGDIPTKKILENKHFIVIKDVNPKVVGHSLVIPKKHVETFLDLPSSLYLNFLKTTNKAVKKILEETGSNGYNLLANNGSVAGQVVSHLHLHILPRKESDGFRCGVD